MTDNERKELAGDLSRQLVHTMLKGATEAIAKPRDPMTLLGIEQHILDLVAFRQDCIEQLAELNTLQPVGPAGEIGKPLEEIGEVQAELDAADVELGKLAGAEASKVDQCANLLRMCDRMTEHCKTEADRIRAKGKRWQAIKEAVEGVVMYALGVAGRSSFESPTNRLRVQRNSAPKVEILDATAVPSRFIKVTLEVPLERWNQMREALPELSQFCKEKERSFITAEISKVLKLAQKQEEAALQLIEGPGRDTVMKKIERVKGARIEYGKHLRVE